MLGRLLAGLGAAPPTHEAVGALSGGGAAVASAALRFHAFGTAGTLEGEGALFVGGASNFSVNPSTGALAGAGAAVAGSSVRTRAHPSSGALSGDGAAAIGAAARTRQHAASGALAAQGSELAGAAVLRANHAVSGVLVGPGARVTGASAWSRVYTVSMERALLVYQIAMLHGLDAANPLVVTDTSRAAGALQQTVTAGGAGVSIATTSSALFEGSLDAWIDSLAALHGLTDQLDVTETSRIAGAVTQTIATVGTSTTVTRV